MMKSAKTKTGRGVGWATGIVFLIFAPLAVSAQVVPALSSPPTLHAFETITSGFTNGFSHSSSGYTVGGYYQPPHPWGWEIRGSYLRWGSQQSRFDAVGGPRVALRWSRYSPYVSALAGVAHSIQWQVKDGQHVDARSNSGPEWKVLGGVDLYAGHHFTFRLGEVAFGRSYAQPGLWPIDFSSGVIYKIPIWGHPDY